jgi:hypothetical protein
MNQAGLVGQAIPKVVRYVTADDSGNPKVSTQTLSEITRKYARANFRQATVKKGTPE